ncbi:hypothetical protein BS47DRAFT_1367366 [Hydnum rufescens UP504]|uniref:Uncharacterized protein n=1 Tax=Hydnum rufescens UP504 TaxID=1448309 RepID=A0A9P6AIG9_9AGAM|nr:hypothetical protein BS47DRAFT_1367366 [Hydnum rufescens UP504]
MHGSNWAEVSLEHNPGIPYSHRLYISGWPSKSEFPSVLGLIVSSLQTEHWTNLWNQLFAVEEHKCLVVKQLDIPATDWHEYIGKQKSVASGNVGTSGEQAREAGKRRKRKEVPGGGSGKGKRRKVLSNPIIDEDESPEPLVGGESPEPLVGGSCLERQVQTTTPVDAGVWSYEILAWFRDPNENLRARVRVQTTKC